MKLFCYFVTGLNILIKNKILKNTSILAKSEPSVEKYLLIRSTINQDRYKETSVTIKMASL